MAFDQAYSRHLNSRSKVAAEPKKKLKKKRSIRFSSGSWLRLSSKSQFNDTAAVVQPKNMSAATDSTQHEEIDDENSMATSSFGSSEMVAREQSSHEEIECDDVSSVVSSSCGSSDMVAVTGNQPSSEISVASPLSEGGILHDHAESSCDSSDNTNGKSRYLSRSSSKRAVRVLIKKTGSNARKDHASNSSKMSDNVDRGTCSSIIKDTRFPEHVEVEPAGQAESEGTSLVKVCPYHHCSLNGHCHDPPPVEKKPFLRRRRQSIEPPKIDKARSVSSPESKPSSGLKKGSNSKKKQQMGSISDGQSKSNNVLDGQSVSDGQSKSNNVLDGQSVSDGQSKSNNVLDGQSVSDKNIYQDFSEAVEDSSALDLKHTTKDPAISLGFGKPKPMSMWQLIHRHMVSDRAAEEENKAHLGADQSKQEEDAELSLSNVVPDLSDSDIGDSNQEVEVRKLLAVKLVREAIEKILLPEVQDQLSESQSVTSDSVEGQELTEKKHQEGPDEGCEDESTTKKVDGDGSITTKEMKKPVKKSLNNWSNLKKWVLLQKFVKELEKVRKINYREPRQLHLEAEQSAEKVSLRHQGADGKRRAEEWMLDYALQQVVSELAPTQRRKVALLVKAFETVVPPQEEGVLQMPAIRRENRKIDSVTPKSDELVSLQSDKPRNAASMDATVGTSEGKIYVKETENFDGGSDVTVSSEQSFAIPAKSCNVEEKSEAGEELTDKKSENLSDDSTVESELRPNSEHYSAESARSTDEIHKVGDVNLVRSTSELVKSESIPVAGVGAVNLVRSTSELGKSESNPVAGVIRENYLNMWHSVCQHVVSSVATKLVLDGNEVDTEEENKLMFDQNPRGSIHEAEFSRSQVLKLVKEAVQEILSPEVSSSSAASGNTSPDQDDGAMKNTGEVDKSIEGSSQGEEKEQDSKNVESVAKSTSDPPKAKNWRKLKKLLLLRRSINAMEEARKLKFRTQQLLPLPSDREPEKVDLRPQMVEERRKAEQWMLDYAVQNKVTQLTSARKKRVTMLVEAFEAVIPLPEM